MKEIIALFFQLIEIHIKYKKIYIKKIIIKERFDNSFLINNLLKVKNFEFSNFFKKFQFNLFFFKSLKKLNSKILHKFC